MLLSPARRVQALADNKALAEAWPKGEGPGVRHEQNSLVDGLLIW
jgi:hypothetical protein